MKQKGKVVWHRKVMWQNGDMTQKEWWHDTEKWRHNTDKMRKKGTRYTGGGITERGCDNRKKGTRYTGGGITERGCDNRKKGTRYTGGSITERGCDNRKKGTRYTGGGITERGCDNRKKGTRYTHKVATSTPQKWGYDTKRWWHWKKLPQYREAMTWCRQKATGKKGGVIQKGDVIHRR